MIEALNGGYAHLRKVVNVSIFFKCCVTTLVFKWYDPLPNMSVFKYYTPLPTSSRLALWRWTGKALWQSVELDLSSSLVSIRLLLAEL